MMRTVICAHGLIDDFLEHLVEATGATLARREIGDLLLLWLVVCHGVYMQSLKIENSQDTAGRDGDDETCMAVLHVHTDYVRFHCA